MRAVVFDGKLRIDARHAEPPAIEGDSVVGVLLAGVSEADLLIAGGALPYRGIPGQEFVGVVHTSPDKALAGKRVVGDPNVACGGCDLCNRGLSAHCRNRVVMGRAGHGGAMAQRLRLPAENLHVVPEGVDDVEAVFAAPLATALGAVRQPRIDERTWVTVVGDGTLGLLCAQVLRLRGAAVRVIGSKPERLALCDKWHIRGRMAEEISARADQAVVIDCSATAQGLRLALGICRPRGTVVLMTERAPTEAVNLQPVVENEIALLGSRAGSMSEAVQLLAEKRIDVKSLVHGRFMMDQAAQAFRQAALPHVLKVVLAPSDSES